MRNAANKYFGNDDKQKGNNNDDNIYEEIYNKIGNKYNNVHLLNDFNHLMHSHSTQFEDIYNILSQQIYNNKACNLSKCLLMKRNQSDRVETNGNKNILKDLYFTEDNEQIITQQFIDRIHCHFFHSFDIGYRISMKERQNIINGQEIRNNDDKKNDDKKNDDLQREQLKLGDEVKIYSESQKKWFHGEIVKIFNDKDGEWLVVEYSFKSKAIQRFSKYIRPINNEWFDNINKDRFVSAISRLISNKRNKYKNVEALGRMYNKKNKFVSGSHQKHNVKITKNEWYEYRFGFRFFYHSTYKHYRGDSDPVAPFSTVPGVNHHTSNFGYFVKDLYIEPLYNNLKDELLKNKLCFIDIKDWNQLYNKSMKHIKSDLARMTICHRSESAKYYEMKQKTQITMNHLIAAMVYCGYDILQSVFTETFRRMNKKESISDIKQRHRNFYFLGRYLRECVECFGMIYNYNKTVRVYHGINDLFMFQSLFGYIKGSFSTTTAYSVAVNFSANTGMILELSIDTKSWILKLFEGPQAVARITCFDMSWLSEYSNEAEIFCVGGLNKFYFKSIIEAPTGTNYGSYIMALIQMTSGMSHGGISTDTLDVNIPNNKLEQQMVYRLLSHQFYKHLPNHKHAHKFELCPKYIEELMESHCNSIKYIQLNQKTHKVLDCMLRTDDDWIDFNVLPKIFPNTDHIKYYAFDKDLKFLQFDEKKHSIFDSILSYIDNNDEAKIKIIDLSIDPKFEQEMREFMKKEYESKFRERGWTVNVYFYDPIKELSESMGISVKDYIEKAKQNDALKKFVDQLHTKFVWIIEILLKQHGKEVSNFNIWKDYDKLGNVVIWMGSHKRATVKHGLYEPVD